MTVAYISRFLRVEESGLPVVLDVSSSTRRYRSEGDEGGHSKLSTGDHSRLKVASKASTLTRGSPWHV